MRELILPSLTLAWRELVRFYRQRSRVASAFLSPVLMWVVIGFGMGRSFQSSLVSAEGGYVEYFFPGSLLMVLLFTAIFSTISIIEDRREGFMQSVLVAPVTRASIVLGRVLGASALAVLQGLLFVVIAPFVGLPLSVESFGLLLLVMIAVSFGLSALGFVIAWRLDSMQGFHAIMNLLMIPMWFLSGALFPSQESRVLNILMAANPMTYGLALMRRALYLNRPFDPTLLPGTVLSVVVIVAFGFILFVIGLREVNRQKVVIG